METHANHLHKAPGKNFWHYFYEFLMLFLAVFCGFLAENFREHQAEHQREKKYIQSLIVDLEKDTAEVRSAITFNLTKFFGMDTLAMLLNKQSMTREDESRLYYLNRKYASNINTMTFSDRTILQLLNSGNLRLISSQTTSDTIMSYYGQPKNDVIGQGKLYGDLSIRMKYFSEDIFDNSTSLLKMNPDSSFYRESNTDQLNLMTKDKAILKKYAQMIIETRGFLAVYLNMLFDIKKRSKNLLSFLKKEYHLK